MALEIWEDYMRGRLKTGLQADSSITLSTEGDTHPLLIGTYSDMVNAVPKSIRQLRETTVIATVARIEGFVRDVLLEFYEARPASLKGGQQLQLDQVVDAALKGDVLGFIAKRQVDLVVNRPVEEIVEYLRKRIGISFDRCPIRIGDLTEMFQTRHVLVHNRGMIDNRYIHRVSGTQFKEGQKRPLDGAYIRHCFDLLIDFCGFVDEQIGAKLASSA